MPGTVADLIKKLKILPEFIRLSSDLAIIGNDDEIVDLNKAQLLVVGVDSDGKQLGTYSPFTVEKRKQKGLQTDFIDLRFTGDFQDNMVIKKTGRSQFELDSTDPKWSFEILRNPDAWPHAIGLTDDNENRVTLLLVRVIEKNVNDLLTVGTSPSKKPVNVN